MACNKTMTHSLHEDPTLHSTETPNYDHGAVGRALVQILGDRTISRRFLSVKSVISVLEWKCVEKREYQIIVELPLTFRLTLVSDCPPPLLVAGLRRRRSSQRFSRASLAAWSLSVLSMASRALRSASS